MPPTRSITHIPHRRPVTDQAWEAGPYFLPVVSFLLVAVPTVYLTLLVRTVLFYPLLPKRSYDVFLIPEAIWGGVLGFTRSGWPESAAVWLQFLPLVLPVLILFMLSQNLMNTDSPFMCCLHGAMANFLATVPIWVGIQVVRWFWYDPTIWAPLLVIAVGLGSWLIPIWRRVDKVCREECPSPTKALVGKIAAGSLIFWLIFLVLMNTSVSQTSVLSLYERYPEQVKLWVMLAAVIIVVPPLFFRFISFIRSRLRP